MLDIPDACEPYRTRYDQHDSNQCHEDRTYKMREQKDDRREDKMHDDIETYIFPQVHLLELVFIDQIAERCDEEGESDQVDQKGKCPCIISHNKEDGED